MLDPSRVSSGGRCDVDFVVFPWNRRRFRLGPRCGVVGVQSRVLERAMGRRQREAAAETCHSCWLYCSSRCRCPLPRAIAPTSATCATWLGAGQLKTEPRPTKGTNKADAPGARSLHARDYAINNIRYVKYTLYNDNHNRVV